MLILIILVEFCMPKTVANATSCWDKRGFLMNKTDEQSYIFRENVLLNNNSITILNPAAFEWLNKSIITWRFWNQRGLDTLWNWFQHGDLNISRMHTLSKSEMMDLGCEIRYLNERNKLVPVHGQDMRTILVDNRLYGIFNHGTNFGNNRYYHGRNTYIVELQLNPSNCLYAPAPPTLLSINHEAPKMDEKNWTPFEYEGAIYFIYSIKPFRVMQMLPSPDPYKSMMDTVSLTSGDLPWAYGVPRGGTPAIRLGAQYLTLFHSSMKPACVADNRIPSTYFMGALTFSAHPPFRILAMSKHPLVPDVLYDKDRHRREKSKLTPIDIVFPVSIVQDGEYLIACIGKNDVEGYLLRIHIPSLLGSLENITQEDLGSSNWTNGRPVPHSFVYSCSQYFDVDYCTDLLKPHNKALEF